MFRGNHPAKVDEKGRLKLPAAFKQLLDAANVTQFYITSSMARARRSGRCRSGKSGKRSWLSSARWTKRCRTTWM